MAHIDVSHGAQHVDVGLVLLNHGTMDVSKSLQRFFHVRFIRKRLSHHHNETALGKFFGEQGIAVNGFAGITDEDEP